MALTISALVVGVKDDGVQIGSYLILATFKRGANAAATTLHSSVTQTVIHEDDAGWNATFVANTSDGGPEVQVTGAVGDNIRWVAKIEVVMAIWV